MQIKMIRGEYGYPDGVSKTYFSADVSYDLPNDLAKSFLEMGSAVLPVEPEEIKADKPKRGKK